MFVFALIVSLLVIAMVLSPFVVGAGGQLQTAASINSPERLEAIKTAILQRYLEDENAYLEKRIHKLAWDQRKAYLTNRYIDAARRLDYLQSLVREQQPQGGHL